jgi:hypothetical protein
LRKNNSTATDGLIGPSQGKSALFLTRCTRRRSWWGQVFVWELNWRTEAHQFPAIITLMIYCMYYESITHKQPFELRCFEYVLMRHSLEG